MFLICKNQNCGRSFEGRPNRAYCSASCKAAINNRRHIERRKPIRDSELRIRINRNVLFQLYQVVKDEPLPVLALSKSDFELGVLSSISRKGNYHFCHDFTIKFLPNDYFQILKTDELNV